MNTTETVPEDDVGRWAVIGGSELGCFLLERWLLHRDFPLAAVGVTVPSDLEAWRRFHLPIHTNPMEFIDDPTLTGIVLTESVASQRELLHAALAAGKHLLLEQSRCESVTDLQQLQQTALNHDSVVGIYQVRQPDHNFRMALQSVANGRLGRITSVCRIDCEYCLSTGNNVRSAALTWTHVLSEVSPWLLTELLQFIPEKPISVQAWPLPETTGFQARLSDANGLSVWLDVQRASTCGLQTGWCLEGTQGSFRAGKIFSLAEDGELREEVVAVEFDAAQDVLADLHHLAASPKFSRDSLQETITILQLRDAIQRSAEQQGVREFLADFRE